MAGSAAFETTDDWGTCKRQIANGVEDLMTNEFVPKAEQLRVQKPVAIDGKGIPARGPPRQPGSPEFLQLMHKPECPRRSDVPAKFTRRVMPHHALRADSRRIKCDPEIEYG